MKPLLIVGCGGHARSIIDVVETTGLWEVIGFVGLPHEVGSTVLGHPVLGIDADLPHLRTCCDHAILAIGQIGLTSHRPRLALQLKQLKFTTPTLVSRHAIVSRHSSIGPGTTVGHGVVVNAGAQVGRHCILNTRSLIEHDAIIGDYCHISTGALINGGVRIGSGTFIGSGALLREGIELPDCTVISAGKRIMGWPLREGSTS
jgi:sugar O-acyltransferase (sialic acid O-acetyltransferase NeuD family)